MNQQPDQQRAMEKFAAAAGMALTEVAEVFKRVAEQFQGITTLLPTPPPEDPRERALWAKQQRSHGPATPRNWGKR